MSTTELADQPTAVPAPANFPVTWPSPEDAALRVTAGPEVHLPPGLKLSRFHMIVC